MARFIAHVVMTPNDGGAPYTVETEFKAGSYPQAWEHISKLGLRFDAKISSHRIQALAGDADDDATEAEVLAFPAPQPTLTVNVGPKIEAPRFYGEAAVAIPQIVPFPYEEESTNDPVAA